MNNKINHHFLQAYPVIFSGLPAMSTENEKELIQFCESYPHYVLSAMPWAAAEIAGVCGFPTLFHMIYDFGGRKIYLPKKQERFKKLYDIDISVEQYNRLLKRVDSAGNIELPSAWGVFIAIRRAAMQMAMRDNVSSTELTRTFGVSMRNIRMIRSTTDKQKGGEVL
ncbi:hypothetical protein EcWSU1_03858 [Enterobacter ludwigii]|uniref:Mor transcription activator domain-containing protein n=1 Tax=Enterobacter ludwigii TaxID=299767 RepID=G8LEP4_9ENTR|nr:hypothetical protein [Enterobacter ludwigii]AEW75286.1 hypothetical protein EcWSU1_03858 [Enterobacter ludwigii]